jgi:hypothetical protein
MGLRCLKCQQESLAGILTIQRVIPMAQKGGSLAMAGEKVTQAEMKKLWDLDHTGEETRVIRGPILCLECETHHYYICGAVPALRLGAYADAMVEGVEALLAEGDE